MSLQFNPQTGKITYRSKQVGEHIFKNGRSIVQINIEYEGGDDWIVPLIWFAQGLSTLAENKPAPVLLTVETSEDSISKEFEVMRFLIEKQVKHRGYIWKFHKSDADPWPSLLHGHDYDKGLILDAITGAIYDSVTRQQCKTLKIKDLKDLQEKLRRSDDFKDTVATLIDVPQ